jgi:hypothetical protein
MQTIGIQIDAKKSGVQILPVNLSVMHKTYCVKWPSAVTHPALELGQQVPFPREVHLVSQALLEQASK